jgi:hypothetical protein
MINRKQFFLMLVMSRYIYTPMDQLFSKDVQEAVMIQAKKIRMFPLKLLNLVADFWWVVKGAAELWTPPKSRILKQ